MSLAGDYETVAYADALSHVVEAYGVKEENILACEIVYSPKIYENMLFPCYVFYFETENPLSSIDPESKQYKEMLMDDAEEARREAIAKYGDGEEGIAKADAAYKEVWDKGVVIAATTNTIAEVYIEAVEVPVENR